MDDVRNTDLPQVRYFSGPGKDVSNGDMVGEPSLTATALRQLTKHCLRYRDPRPITALMQLANTLPPFLLLCGLMLWGMAQGWWPMLLLSVPAGALLVRLFIIQHDCGHGSFFRSRTANDRLGQVLSLMTVTPYESWKRAHALHHATTGNLNRRGTGDIHTLTVREYLALSRWGRLRYRIYRNPLALILLGSPLNFLVLQRLPMGMGLPWRTAWREVSALNLLLAASYAALGYIVGGIGTVILVIVPTVSVAAWIGGWLFFVQHQHEGAVWESGDDWNFHRAALAGSSYYLLPKPLQWVTGNVGLHHIHHLNSRIPNYRLQECLEGHEMLGQLGRLTLWKSFRCAKLALWDEDARKLVGFASVQAPARLSA
ncbi:fatty acid desaturase [Indioceanicola profundi]|uniref:fatty acid desaturase n=1 Tax=Indioceanicola profundi TaxID=2220096 RepID=UPI001CED1497|nr:fatty acid desaturase [Indioceanicola profundi]